MAQAQEKAVTKVSVVQQKGETVRFSLTSSQPFIFASNRYMLYIGDKEFALNEQSVEHEKGLMTFLIPAADFKALRDGASIYLTYGQVDVTLTNMEEMANTTRRCWSLGKFSKDLLTR
jgi:hypothetical protein